MAIMSRFYRAYLLLDFFALSIFGFSNSDKIYDALVINAASNDTLTSGVLPTPNSFIAKYI